MKKRFLTSALLLALTLTTAAPAFADPVASDAAVNAKPESAASISDTARSASTGIAAPMERGDSSVGQVQAAESAAEDALLAAEDPAAGNSSTGTAADEANGSGQDAATAGSTDGTGQGPATAGSTSDTVQDPEAAGSTDGSQAGEGSDGLAPAPAWTPDQGLPALGALTAEIMNDGLLLSWTGAEEFDGYQISYAKNVLFLRAKKFKIDALEVSSPDSPAGPYSCHTPLEVNTAKQFYIRVRGYRVYEGTTYYSGWTQVCKPGKSAAGIKYVTDGNANLDVRQQAWSKLKNFGISQGSCTDGTYVYMCFEHRNGDDNGSGKARIKIAKVRIADWTVVNVSPKGQKLGHANDITWNPDQGYLVVTGAKTNDPYVRLVSPDTLKKIGKKKIKLGTSFSYVKAFNAIDYDPETQTYYIRSRNYGGKCFTLDQNFRIISDATMPTVFPTYAVQSCTSVGDYFLIPQAWYQSSTKNSVTIFDKAGNMIQHIKIKVTGELESLFFIGNQLYATVHKHVTSSYMTGFIFRILL